MKKWRDRGEETEKKKKKVMENNTTIGKECLIEQMDDG